MTNGFKRKPNHIYLLFIYEFPKQKSWKKQNKKYTFRCCGVVTQSHDTPHRITSNIKTRNLVIYCWTNEIDITERYIFLGIYCGMTRVLVWYGASHQNVTVRDSHWHRQTKVFLFRSGRIGFSFMYIYVGDVYVVYRHKQNSWHK